MATVGLLAQSFVVVPKIRNRSLIHYGPVSYLANIVYFVRVRCLRACVHACMRACVHACMRACVHACMRACVHACMRACVHACMRACVHACVDIVAVSCLRQTIAGKCEVSPNIKFH